MVLSVVFAMVSMVFTACNDEGDEEIKDNGGEETVLSGLKLLNNREIDRNGGAFYWAVRAAGEWALDAASLPEWLQIAPLKGGKGTTGVVVEFAELTDDNGRTAELPFKMGTEEIKITVKQTADGKTESTVCEFLDTKVFGIEGGKLQRRVSVSADWTVSTTDSWLTVSPENGVAGETELTLEAEASNGVDARVAVLSFNLGDTIMELAVIQGLNQSFPKLSIAEEVAVTGRQATMKGTCEFNNDELAISEVGFAYLVQGPTVWQELPCEADLTNVNIAFDTAVMLAYGQSYDYKPYAKIGEEVFYGDVASFFIESKPAPADGVWFYENFDGMYDPETKTYSQTAIDVNYNYWNNFEKFDMDGGFLRKNQPAAIYSVVAYDAYKPAGSLVPGYFRCDMRDGTDDGKISAMIKPATISSSLGWKEGEGAYEGASGNWKFNCKYMSPCSFIITGLDFDGGTDLELTFGYLCISNGTKGLKVYVSVDGTTWTEKPFTVLSTKIWNHIGVDIDSNVTAIKIEATNGTRNSCIDDIKVAKKL